MINWLPIGFDEALQITLNTITPLGVETLPVSESAGRVAAEDLTATVDSPSIDASLKDGYAVRSKDVSQATPEQPVRLHLAGTAAAGADERMILQPNQAIRVLTGAEIPEGADAVLAEEFADIDQTEGMVLAKNTAEPGRNIMPKATDVATGSTIVKTNRQVSPGTAGLLAAAGVNTVSVFKRPTVAIVATGDEIVVPGEPLSRGKLYASNMVTLGAFCRQFGMEPRMFTAKDEFEAIRDKLETALSQADALLTSGGAWTGDRDLVVKVLETMGWIQKFHRIRIGPGKAVGFGMLNEKPIFILPGGPPSNLMGFLQIALPGLRTLSGDPRPTLREQRLPLASDIRGRDMEWTQFIFGWVNHDESITEFTPLRQKGRLQSMAEANAVVAIPEGETFISQGTVVSVQLL